VSCLNKLIQSNIIIQIAIELVLISLKRIKLLLSVFIKRNLRESKTIPKYVDSMYLDLRHLIIQLLHFRITLNLLLSGERIL
jgi:hypothetical protein